MVTEVQQNRMTNEFKVFPNPCNDLLNLQIELAEGPLTVSIFDMKGALVLQESLQVTKPGPVNYSLKVNQLSEGSYILKIESSGRIHTDQIFILRN